MRQIIKCSILLFLMIFALGCTQTKSPPSDFAAYYTSYGEKDDITGAYADVIIRFADDKKFIFCRETSFLPFLLVKDKKWYVNELIERKGDGEGIKHDKYNQYAYVRIIKNSAEEIVVHWRYVPDFEDPTFTGVVHESFSIRPNGSVKRTVQPARPNLADFDDPGNWFIEEFLLKRSGIEQISLKEPTPSKSQLSAIEGSPVISESIINPLLWWTFDDGLRERDHYQRDVTTEKGLGMSCQIGGNISLFKKGVSGTALAFDGYYSNVVIPDAQPPEEPKSYTLEAWIALGAYPWLEGAILDMSGNKSGVYLGISDLGQLIFKLHGMKKEYVLKSKKEIDLYTWTHVAATYILEKNTANIYIDGNHVGRLNLGQDELNLQATDISIGLNKTPKRTTEHVSRDYPPDVRTPEGNQPMIYGIEGLLDEVKIYNEALSPAQIKASYNLLSKNKTVINNPDLEPRLLPGEVDGKNAEKFNAYYTNLKYHELWDNLWRSSAWPDIVVRFDELPCNVVYWRGPNYGPGWVTENNIWMCDQSSEIMTFYGCAEHMADKQNRFSHVRLIENTDARIVVHWRYASADIMYIFENHRTWSDEYHYIYPDGSAIRYVNYYDDDAGWQDVQFFAEPGSTPEDKLNLQALTVANLAGDTYKMDWSEGIPENKLEDASISIINFKSDYKVFVIYPDGSEIGAWGEQERATPETHFAGPWNHWPVSQMPNDGRYAMKTDRVTHSALGGAGPEKYAIFGFTNQNIAELVPLARFWNNAPKVTIETGAENVKYDQAQKAYVMKALGDTISMSINASKESPLHNPCFVIKGWNKDKIELQTDGQVIPRGKEFRYGLVPTEGGYNLVVWIKQHAESSVKIKIISI